MNSIGPFIDNLAITSHGILLSLLLPSFILYVLYRELPTLKGQEKKIVVLLFLSILIAQIIPMLLGIRSLRLHGLQAQIPYVIVWELFFTTMAYRLLKPKLLYVWINNDEKFKTMITPRNGSEISMLYPHPLRLTVEASWIFVYIALLFLVSPWWGFLGDKLGWNYYIKMGPGILVFSMFFTHYFLVSIVKCPYCNFPIFDMFKTAGLETNNFFIIVCQILFKRSFKCMHCGAHFAVGKSSKSQLPEVK